MDKQGNTKKERNRNVDLERLRKLRPLDDDFMRCLFKDDIPLAQHVLRILTGKSDLEIVSIETQADLKRLVGARSVCLDAYGKDSQGRRYDIEIQRSDDGASAHRARYHSSAMDIDNLDSGDSFEKLPDTYTIFITEKDLYGQSLPLYPIERVNLGTNELFGDGGHILYVNAEYEGDDELGILMHDFRCSDPDEMLDDMLAVKARYYKNTGQGEKYMSRIVEEIMEEVRAETVIDTRVDSILSLMETLNFTAEQACDALKIAESEREVLISEIYN